MIRQAEEEEERGKLMADAQRLAKQIKLTAKDKDTFRQTYLGGAELIDADMSAITDLVNALRARAGEPKWGE